MLFSHTTTIVTHMYWLMHAIRSTLEAHVPTPEKSPIIYYFSAEAHRNNSKLLKCYNCDLEKLIEAHPDSDLSYGT